jgi:hypothetical protein
MLGQHSVLAATGGAAPRIKRGINHDRELFSASSLYAEKRRREEQSSGVPRSIQRRVGDGEPKRLRVKEIAANVRPLEEAEAAEQVLLEEDYIDGPKRATLVRLGEHVKVFYYEIRRVSHPATFAKYGMPGGIPPVSE